MLHGRQAHLGPVQPLVKADRIVLPDIEGEAIYMMQWLPSDKSDEDKFLVV